VSSPSCSHHWFQCISPTLSLLFPLLVNCSCFSDCHCKEKIHTSVKTKGFKKNHISPFMFKIYYFPLEIINVMFGDGIASCTLKEHNKLCVYISWTHLAHQNCHVGKAPCMHVHNNYFIKIYNLHYLTQQNIIEPHGYPTTLVCLVVTDGHDTLIFLNEASWWPY
jgi:hypothetical protein